MKNNSFLLTVKLSGVNLNRIYKQCLNSNIKLTNINRIDYKNIVFDIEKSQLNLLKQIAKQQNYQLQVIKQYGIVKLLSFLAKRVGVVAGLAVFLVATVLSSFFVWDIKIYGNNKVDKSQILNVLKNNGISGGSWFSNNNLNGVEDQILNTIDGVSLCSVFKKGSTIIVNIKEKVFLDTFFNTEQQDVVATQNLTINSISVVQGTPLKKAGDSVKAGETIVAGYFLDANGQKVPCKANANISATTWFSKTLNYQKVKKVATRTGNKIVNSKLSLFGVDFTIKNSQNIFENFEVEQNCNPVFKNNFLPFYMHTTTYYQTTISMVEQNFLQDKNSVIQNLKAEVLNSVPQNLTVVKTFDITTETPDAFVVTFYAEVNIQN